MRGKRVIFSKGVGYFTVFVVKKASGNDYSAPKNITARERSAIVNLGRLAVT